MNFRNILIVLATAPVTVVSLAQTPPAQPQTAPAQAPAPGAASSAASAGAAIPTVPPPNCVKPVYPGKNGPDAKIREFNATYKAYGDCIRKYVDNVRTLSNNAVQAGNDAVTDYNKFTEETQKLIDADK
jgi:hypothetical protein